MSVRQNQSFRRRIMELIAKVEQDSITTEAELERIFLNVVEEELKSHGVIPTIEQQRKIVHGRGDARIGGLVFEFKKPGLMDLSSWKGQAEQYIDEYRQKGLILRGILTNGKKILFIDEDEEVIEEGDLESNVWMLEAWVTSLAMKVASPVDLKSNLGPISGIGKATIKKLFEAYEEYKEAPFICESYKIWDGVYGCATNLDDDAIAAVKSFAKNSLDIQLQTKIAVKDFLFAVETYLSILMKLLVAEVAIQKSIIPASSLGELLSDQPVVSYSRLSDRIPFLSRVFEYDTFYWFIDLANQHPELERVLAQYLSDIVQILSFMDFTGVSTDLVKQMYQDFFDSATRRALGEFYTPDKLVDEVLDSVGYEGNDILASKLLDPACGSGTFLVRAIDRFTKVCKRKNLNKVESLRRVIDAIIGVDIHPFAVAMAKVNYLLAVGRLIDPTVRRAVKSLPIPIYWGDSLARATLKAQFGGTTQIRTVEVRVPVLGAFVLPDPREIDWDKLIDVSLMAIDNNWSNERFLSSFSEDKRLAYTDVLLRFLQVFKDREAKGLDGRWLSTLRNFIVIDKIRERCDYVVGNPPWVRIHNINEDIRKELIGRFEVYKKDEKNGKVVGWRPKLQKTKAPFPQQIDYCMAFVEAGLNYLNGQGKLGFVLTAKTMNALYANLYRRMLIEKTTLLRIVDYSLSEKQFFEEATNYPMILAIGRSAPKTDVEVYVHAKEQMNWSMNQADLPLFSRDLESPWCIAPPSLIKMFRKMQRNNIRLGDCYAVQRGVMTSANDLFLVSDFSPTANPNIVTVINGRDEKKNIEKELLRPVVRGEDLVACEYKTSGYIIWTHSDSNGEVRRKMPPHAQEYFESYRKDLLKRDDFKKGQPIWVIFRVSTDKLLEKTGWGELARMMEAVIIPEQCDDDRLGKRKLIPLQTLYFICTHNSNINHAFAAFLNSTPVKAFITSFAERARGRYFRHISWTVGLIPLPKPLAEGNEDDPSVDSLIQLSKRMHRCKGKDNTIAKGIDATVASLYGLSDRQLHELGEYLEACGVPTSYGAKSL